MSEVNNIGKQDSCMQSSWDGNAVGAASGLVIRPKSSALEHSSLSEGKSFTINTVYQISTCFNLQGIVEKLCIMENFKHRHACKKKKKNMRLHLPITVKTIIHTLSVLFHRSLHTTLITKNKNEQQQNTLLPRQP